MTDPVRSKITGLYSNGQKIVRAHIWASCGYSTRTFNTASEAEAKEWIEQMVGKKCEDCGWSVI